MFKALKKEMQFFLQPEKELQMQKDIYLFKVKNCGTIYIDRI